MAAATEIRSTTKKIDGDTHFQHTVDFNDLKEMLATHPDRPKSALEKLTAGVAAAASGALESIRKGWRALGGLIPRRAQSTAPTTSAGATTAAAPEDNAPDIGAGI